MAAQGSPQKRDEYEHVDDVWYYGGTGRYASTVSINSIGKVTGWEDNLGILRLHAISINQAGTFGLGSTTAEVMAAQGSPQKIEEYGLYYDLDVWYYKRNFYSTSTVNFNKIGKVTGWSDSGFLRLE